MWASHKQTATNHCNSTLYPTQPHFFVHSRNPENIQEFFVCFSSAYLLTTTATVISNITMAATKEGARTGLTVVSACH